MFCLESAEQGRGRALRPCYMYIRHPFPITARRGVCNRHHWDEEFRNYDTDEDVNNEIRMEQHLIKLFFIARLCCYIVVMLRHQVASLE